jgi:hypothetical protein
MRIKRLCLGSYERISQEKVKKVRKNPTIIHLGAAVERRPD